MWHPAPDNLTKRYYALTNSITLKTTIFVVVVLNRYKTLVFK
ncbi:hypothetical protein NIASO_01080 [Niabella soli DSM 19437]|uniref:Uncharacterized protein n=1 Tax=Niabella soli DSM 19437 TaxID=929713 RepID=W0F5G4_9BACT|nr:hypothetical protein NIASO_01080 [Niabella soli DSM 19437]